MTQAETMARELKTMTGVVLPGNSTVAFREQAVPVPGHGQVLVRMKASSICGSDIRAIYREHLGVGDEAYRGVIAGHEPAGQIVEVGPGCKQFGVGDRVVLYHISGCGICEDCKTGYMISCHSQSRAAYGWQRDGGHAEYLLAEENTCIRLPDNLTYEDGALVACGFGTAWEALTRIGVNGRDRLLITGLGPVGLAAAMLGKALGARHVIGVDTSAHRIDLARTLGLVDDAFLSDADALGKIKDATGGKGCEASIDCSGAAPARKLALGGVRQWGRCAFVGEGSDVQFDVSPMLIHPQITLFGSWVTSLGHMEDLVERLSRWDLHPDKTVTHRFTLAQAADAYQVADAGQSGKVVIVSE
ncbi:alcohol dehydrogenase [Capsulimonas corticalis]|uniref:Alcohol dehydrogenase n=1 Tax=Capsulimonas corticalis TaxID=2219043 RepID=A0A402CQN1_9BACT|nr:zinc-binding dehydrogenase [Capsulimonas corticalis]BDI34364.1 alcohol dehydrogenase [Capsulimonas corticalis]